MSGRDGAPGGAANAPVPANEPPPGVRTVASASPHPTRVVLIRHGEANCNVDGVVGGRLGCTGLSTRGRAQARALAARLAETGELAGATARYTSVLARATETAEIVAGTMGEGAAVADCSLCELHPGEADGITWDEFRARYGEPDFDTDPDGLVAPGGESWNGFVRRAGAAMTDVADRHRGELVVVVCHAGVIEASMLSFLPFPAGTRRLGLPTEHTSLTEWERSDTGTWRLVRYNDAAHLRALAGQERPAVQQA